MPKEDSDPWPLSSRAVTEQNRSGQDGYTILQTLASGDGPPPLSSARRKTTTVRSVNSRTRPVGSQATKTNQ